MYLLAAVLFAFGIFHFLHPRELLVAVPTFLPGGIIWVKLVGAAFILVSISFVTNRMVKLAAYLLALLLLIFILTVHLPNWINSGNEESTMMAMTNLLKDTAIFGFALHIAASAHHQRLDLTDDD
ncbi:hypothetical protein A8C56_19855 [Niabella ginsenosidivorans]|uniref:DoxX family protein n=1 Tax=Niabella ginsenosidivorans TaxID=1176587 RepID=A0A1A9I8S3_9BACT|nr:hypothetical protein A8C56_19855 [Niabella ginsenosidivorans]